MKTCSCRFNWLEIDQKHHLAANEYVNEKYPKSVDKDGKVTGHTEFPDKLALCSATQDKDGNPVFIKRKGFPIHELLYQKLSYLFDLAKKGELTAQCKNCGTKKLLKWVDSKRLGDNGR